MPDQKENIMIISIKSYWNNHTLESHRYETGIKIILTAFDIHSKNTNDITVAVECYVKEHQWKKKNNGNYKITLQEFQLPLVNPTVLFFVYLLMEFHVVWKSMHGYFFITLSFSFQCSYSLSLIVNTTTLNPCYKINYWFIPLQFRMLSMHI